MIGLNTKKYKRLLFLGMSIFILILNIISAYANVTLHNFPKATSSNAIYTSSNADKIEKINHGKMIKKERIKKSGKIELYGKIPNEAILKIEELDKNRYFVDTNRKRSNLNKNNWKQGLREDNISTPFI